MSNYVESIARLPRTLTEREVALLLRTTVEHAAGWRDHVIFSLALGTGLWEHVLALDIGDVFDGAGRARRHVALRVFKRSILSTGIYTHPTDKELVRSVQELPC